MGEIFTMSNWLSKARSSLMAAEILIDEFANQSVHCSYYGCVQYIYHLMLTQMNEEEYDLNNGVTKRTFEHSRPKRYDGSASRLGTHEWLRGELYRSLRSRHIDEADDIITHVKTISEIRIIADYRSEQIPVSRARGIHRKAIRLIEQLKNIY
jgi:hypothetical protein